LSSIIDVSRETIDFTFELCFYIISSRVVALTLVRYSLKFLMTLIKEQGLHPNDFVALVLEHIRRYSDSDYILSEMLHCIRLFHFVPEVLPLLLECAMLTPCDLEDFESNPLTFVSTIYSTCKRSQCAPRVEAVVLIGAIITKNPKHAQFLFDLKPNEVSMRLFAILPDVFRAGTRRTVRNLGCCSN
jgi:hypothetical protein